MNRRLASAVAGLALGVASALAAGPSAAPSASPSPSAAPSPSPSPSPAAAPSPVATAARGGLTEDLRYRMAVDAARSRRWDKARSLFENLRKAYPGDDRVPFQLAQVFIEMGQDAKAQAIAMELLGRDPSDRFGKALMERIRQKTAQPDEPLTFGDDPAEAARSWERGDEFHLSVSVATKAGQLVLGEPRLVEGPAPAMSEPAPKVRYRLRLEGPGPAQEIAMDPAPGPTALLEKPGPDGKLSGQLLAVPPGQELDKVAWVPFVFSAKRLAMVDPAGAPRGERALSTPELWVQLAKLARPQKIPGLGPPISPKMGKPPRLLPLARLTAKLPHEYSAAGQPAGMWLRVRLVAELFVYPGLRRVPDAEVPRACPYLVSPLVPPDARAMENLIQKLLAYLDRATATARIAVERAWAPLAPYVDMRLLPALDAYRRDPARPAPELRALIVLALVSARLTEMGHVSGSPTAAKEKAAEALLLLSRFRLDRK